MRSKRPVDLAVVLELEVHRRGQALPGRALVGDLELLAAERDAGDVAVGGLGEVQAEPAPARADVEHALPRRDARAWRRGGASWRAAPPPGRRRRVK